MIVRILGEGQFEVPDDAAGLLDRLDGALSRAVEAGDHAGFDAMLAAMLNTVRTRGRPVPPDHLSASDLVLPGPGATIGEVRRLLSGQRVIPA